MGASGAPIVLVSDQRLRRRCGHPSKDDVDVLELGLEGEQAVDALGVDQGGDAGVGLEAGSDVGAVLLVQGWIAPSSEDSGCPCLCLFLNCSFENCLALASQRDYCDCCIHKI